MEKDKEKLTTIKKEMGITHKEFYDRLPSLLENIPYSQTENVIRFQIDNKSIEIIIEPEKYRKLSQSVQLPVTVVIFNFFGFSEDNINDFINYFNLKFMKGGG